MDASPLGSIPAELRNAIYELVLLKPAVQSYDTTRELKRSWSPSHVDILSVCRQTAQEASAIFYSGNRFVLNTEQLASDDEIDISIQHGRKSLDTQLWSFPQWLSRIGRNAALLRTVEVNFGTWQLDIDGDGIPAFAVASAMGETCGFFAGRPIQLLLSMTIRLSGNELSPRLRSKMFLESSNSLSVWKQTIQAEMKREWSKSQEKKEAFDSYPADIWVELLDYMETERQACENRLEELVTWLEYDDLMEREGRFMELDENFFACADEIDATARMHDARSGRR